MTFRVTNGGGSGSSETCALHLANQYETHSQLATGLARASLDTAGSEFDDITSSETIAVSVLPKDAKMVEFEVHQSASDDGSSVSKVDLLADGSSILDSKVSLDSSGEAETTGTISSGKLEQTDGTVLEVDVDGGSDDSSPPRVFAQVTYRYVKDQFNDPTA